MKRVACTLLLGVALTGACAGGADSGPTPVAMAGDGTDVSTRSDRPGTGGSERDGVASMDPDAPTSTRPPGSDPSVGTDGAGQVVDPVVGARCNRLVAEIERREAAGALTEEDDDAEELTEEQIERYQLEPPALEGGVLGPHQRPVFPSMPDRLDMALLDDGQLWLGVEACWDQGVLAEEEGLDDVDDELCGDLAALTAEEVAAWAEEEGDEIVDEEYAWCDLPRPDRA